MNINISPEGNLRELTEIYLRTVLVSPKPNIGATFAPWRIMQDMKFARLLAEVIASKIDTSKVSGICILANSGIPLGVLVAQILQMPAFFYKSSPWTIDDEPGPLSIYPRIPTGSNVVLFDSHITSGFTSSSCYDMLKENGITVESVISIISFLDVPGITINRRNVHYNVISNAIDHVDTLLQLLSVEEYSDISIALKTANDEARKQSFPSGSSDLTGYLSTKLNRFSKLLLSLISQSKTPLEYHDQELAQNLRTLFASRESALWLLFSNPGLIRKISLDAGNAILINQYDVIVATGYLGTIFALCMAWHNNFNGQIISTHSPIGWDKLPKTGSIIKYLICSMRLRTGYYVNGALNLISQYADPERSETIFALRLWNEEVDFPRNRFLEWIKKGLKLIILS